MPSVLCVQRLKPLEGPHAGEAWRCLVRRALHAPHLRAGAIPRTPELALALANF